ncbi:MAG: hypothetical protein WBP26_04840 [Candidatus Saccharimonadales bacterium]
MSHRPTHPSFTNQQPETPEQPIDYSQPVAYDKQGNPLYAHPPQAQQPAPAAPQTQTVHMARPIQPEAPTISDEVRELHNESLRQFPHLNLSEGEYVINAVKRHPIGLVFIWAFVSIIVVLFLGLGAYLASDANGISSSVALDGQINNSTKAVIVIVAFFLSVLAIIGGLVATYVYRKNNFYLTNESVIQYLQYSLFSKRQQTVSLGNIEDASYYQSGIIPHIFNYGQVRLSTEGDETTYRFSYTANPERHVAILNNAVEAFKLGRPVTDD